MPDPYASVIAILYGLGFVILVAALPARLKARRRSESRKPKPVATAQHLAGDLELQASSILTADAKDAR
jgi:hypothetical protein